MAVYEYKAIAKTGKAVKGIVDADSPAAARRKLREQELFPTDIGESFAKAKAKADEGAGGGWGRISHREIAMATRQLAVLLRAGMPLAQALTALIEQSSNARLGKTIFDVRDQVNGGSSLAGAMGAHPQVFSDLYTNMVGAGESSGALEQVLFRLADILERQVRMRNKIIASLAYPCVMIVVGMSVVTFLMMVIVPRFKIIFAHQKQELPGITKGLIAVCTFLGHWWWAVILGVLMLFALWRAWVARTEGRRRWDKLKLSLPFFGKLYMKMICARMSRTLGTMLASGLTMMKGLDVVKSVVGNRVVEEALDDVKSDVRRGRDLAVPLRETGLFPSMLLHMVDVGERSGELESMLMTVAETYDEDVELTVEALVSLLEPVLIVVMACFVGLLVVSILLPILRMSRGM